jgi:hypothetical protein
MRKFNPPTNHQNKTNMIQPSTSGCMSQVSMKANPTNQTNQPSINRNIPTETESVSVSKTPNPDENTETLPRPLANLPSAVRATSHQRGTDEVTQGRDKRGRFEKTEGVKVITEEQKIENAKSSRVTKIKKSIVEQMKTIQSIR